MFSVAAATLVALVGAVLLPWMYLLTRTVVRERAARVRAEGRAEMAAHLHDTVLQALTLIQKQTADPAVVRLARGTERELRAWLYGAPPAGDDDFAAALVAVAQEVEDRFGITIELGTVGTAPLSRPLLAVLGAAREALTNAGKHAGVRRVSAYAEVTDTEAYALVRDRGRGFDPASPNGVDASAGPGAAPPPASASAGRRGIRDSIEERMRRPGGTATVRSAPGQGTEVELRMPLGTVG
jgi:signal transduction histidine kinase